MACRPVRKHVSFCTYVHRGLLATYSKDEKAATAGAVADRKKGYDCDDPALYWLTLRKIFSTQEGGAKTQHLSVSADLAQPRRHHTRICRIHQGGLVIRAIDLRVYLGGLFFR